MGRAFDYFTDLAGCAGTFILGIVTGQWIAVFFGVLASATVIFNNVDQYRKRNKKK